MGNITSDRGFVAPAGIAASVVGLAAGGLAIASRRGAVAQRMSQAGTALDTMLAAAPGQSPVLRTFDGAKGLTEGVRLLRSRPPQQIDATERILRNGTLTETAETLENKGGSSGAIKLLTITDPDDANVSLQAMRALPNFDAAHHEFGFRVGRALGIDHLMPTATRRADGSAYIAYGPGIQWEHAGVRSSEDVGSLLRTHYRETMKLEPAVADKAARMDRQLMQFFDYLVANWDRKPGNGMASLNHDNAWLIDQGSSLRGESLRATKPWLKDPFFDHAGGRPRVDLDPETAEFIRRRLTADVLREAHSSLRRPHPELDKRNGQYLARAASERSFQRILKRRDQAVANHGFDYQPVTPFVRNWGRKLTNLRVATNTYATGWK